MTSGRAGPICLLLCALVALPAAAQTSGGRGGVILDQGVAWRRYYRFRPNGISPAALKAGGQKLLGKLRWDRLREGTEKWLDSQGGLPAGADWADHAVLAAIGARWFNPHPAPPPPADWAAADFDDGAWVRHRGPFQAGAAAGITTPGLGQYDESVDLKLHQAFYRARFVVSDARSAGPLTLRLAYAGGARVLLNGREVARGHLPAGALSPEEPGADYPAAAYAEGGEALSRRALGPVVLPAEHLRQGVNVLAVEIRASCFHPVVLTAPIQPNWGGPMRPWPHARLVSLELRGGPGAAAATARPPGVQVWAEDMHHRVLSTDFLPPGEEGGAVRLVGARNGTFSAQIVVGADRALAQVHARCEGLQQVGGSRRIAPPAVQLLPMAGYGLADWSLARLGDERGLGASFPTMQELARLAGAAPAGRPVLFDQILSAAPDSALPAGTCRPFWLRVAVPADAPAGTYRGAAEVRSGAAVVGSLPVELEVIDWALPDPKAFRTLVGCEQNPYAVARQYGVKLWSQEHFGLIEASFRQLARAGNQWLNVPVLARTEFGNGEDSMVRWMRTADGQWQFDWSVLDRYVDLAGHHGRPPRVIQFVVMQGMKGMAQAAGPQVSVWDRGSGRSRLMPVGDAAGPEARQAWTAFGAALLEHMRARGLDRSTYWGAPWEQEAEPGLKKLLAQCAPGVYWTAGPHEMMANGTYAKDATYYRLVTDIRYHGGWAAFRDDQGWKSRTIHLLNPRAGGTIYALHTTSHPFAFRVMVDRALAMGRSGFTRLAADGWAATHYAGMPVPRWLTGIPVLFLLWPGRDGAESSARFEALVEGIQETEARIALEQVLDGGRLPAPLAAKARATLRDHFRQTDICQGNSILHSIEQYHFGWQDRSRRLYQTAAEAGAGR